MADETIQLYMVNIVMWNDPKDQGFWMNSRWHDPPKVVSMDPHLKDI